MKKLKEQTPVEWLESKMKDFAIDLDLLSYVEQAKEMEKQVDKNDFSKWLYDNRNNFDKYPAYMKYEELYSEYLKTL